MGTYKKINGQAVPVTTEGHPQYYFQTKAQAEAALSTLEVGADVFVEEGGNEDVLPRIEQLESDLTNKQDRLSTYESQSFASEFTAQHDGFALISATKDVAGNTSSVTYKDMTANVTVGGVVMSPDFSVGVYQYANFPIIKGHKYIRSGITNVSALVERILY